MKTYLERAIARLNAIFGRGLVLAMSLAILVSLAVSLAMFGFFDTAAPSSLTITSGPEGSAFRRTAESYKKILAKEGVTLNILPSEGSRDNLAKLANPKVTADVGFVLGGEADSAATDKLMSLGSISYQPLMIFYRGPTKHLLSEFKGFRIDVGPEGSGSNILAHTLLEANGIKAGDGTTYIDTATDDTARALNEGRIEAFFAMSDSTPTALIRQLLRTPNVHLFNVTQADGYVRRIPYLNKLLLPKGALDFGEDLPSEDVHLVGPTVELVARDSLHPALSDLLLEAAREVHGKPGLYKKRGEFPAPLEHEFRISPDATRYYASGKGFLYRTFPFWVASLIARIIAVLVPVVLLLIPAIRIVPALYRWRMT
ncbi:MAG TPA: TAXI family TRAP transporter solute-binding subunit, partial [Burkholderiaceae bacterium]